MLRPPPTLPRVTAALGAAGRLFGTRSAYVLGRSRAAGLLPARYAVWAGLHEAGMTLAAIGAASGGRHGDSVAHGVRQARRRAAEDAEYAAAIALIAQEVRDA